MKSTVLFAVALIAMTVNSLSVGMEVSSIKCSDVTDSSPGPVECRYLDNAKVEHGATIFIATDPGFLADCDTTGDKDACQTKAYDYYSADKLALSYTSNPVYVGFNAFRTYIKDDVECESFEDEARLTTNIAHGMHIFDSQRHHIYAKAEQSNPAHQMKFQKGFRRSSSGQLTGELPIVAVDDLPSSSADTPISGFVDEQVSVLVEGSIDVDFQCTDCESPHDGVHGFCLTFTDLNDDNAEPHIIIRDVTGFELYDMPLLKASASSSPNGALNFFGIITSTPIGGFSIQATAKSKTETFAFDRLILAKNDGLKQPFEAPPPCGDGVFDPATEQCDTAIDSKNCNADCTCRKPFKKDGLGSCTNCGNAKLDEGEECDFKMRVAIKDSSCTAQCMCQNPFVPMGTGARRSCSKCGNGLLDADKKEQCDIKIDTTNCDDKCRCIGDWVQNIDKPGMCTKCGNQKWDEDQSEECDHRSPDVIGQCDKFCRCSQAKGFVATGKGTCSRCGNGRLDDGEVCDPQIKDAMRTSNPGCNSESCSCSPPYGADRFLPGMCNKCGDGFLGGPGEQCDNPADTNCIECKCAQGFEYVADMCTPLCGNSRLDPGETCDNPLDTNCVNCQCTGETVANHGECSLCGNKKVDQGEECDIVGSNFVEGCDERQCKCTLPYVAHPNRPGECYVPCGTDPSMNCCGNGVLDTSEECESELSEHCDSECKCESDWVPDVGDRNGQCVHSCGNNVFDIVYEQCEKTLSVPELCDDECKCTAHHISDQAGSCSKCGNGEFDPDTEECDKAMDTVNCDSKCTCLHGMIPSETEGHCVHHCGDGRYQPLREMCEKALDPEHCNDDCTCMDGYDPLRGMCISCGNLKLDAPGETCDASFKPDQHCSDETCQCSENYQALGPENNCILSTCDSDSCCGDGKFDVQKEECDTTFFHDLHCDKASCKCTPPYVSNHVGGCQHHCGDGVFDASLEECEKSLDENCNDDCKCSSILASFAFIPDGEGKCTLCGNKKMDEGEECDYGLDSQFCSKKTCQCVAKLPNQDGTCSDKDRCVCGNGVTEADNDEMCDTEPHCSLSCKCDEGYYVQPGGGCASVCGDSKLADGEDCDSGAHCDSECKCHAGFAPANRLGCVDDCGNNVRTGNEICDGGDHCADKCRCSEGFKPTSPLSEGCVVDLLCGNHRLDIGEECDGGPNCYNCMCDSGYTTVRAFSVNEGKVFGCESKCGDGMLTSNEDCDSGDHCEPSTCKCENGYYPVGKMHCEATCGDSIIADTEECDGGDSCQADCFCKPSFVPLSDHAGCELACGNGRLDFGEFCDGGEHCKADCTCPPCYKTSTQVDNTGCESIKDCICGSEDGKVGDKDGVDVVQSSTTAGISGTDGSAASTPMSSSLSSSSTGDSAVSNSPTSQSTPSDLSGAVGTLVSKINTDGGNQVPSGIQALNQSPTLPGSIGSGVDTNVFGSSSSSPSVKPKKKGGVVNTMVNQIENSGDTAVPSGIQALKTNPGMPGSFGSGIKTNVFGGSGSSSTAFLSTDSVSAPARSASFAADPVKRIKTNNRKRSLRDSNSLGSSLLDTSSLASAAKPAVPAVYQERPSVVNQSNEPQMQSGADADANSQHKKLLSLLDKLKFF